MQHMTRVAMTLQDINSLIVVVQQTEAGGQETDQYYCSIITSSAFSSIAPGPAVSASVQKYLQIACTKNRYSSLHQSREAFPFSSDG